MADRVAAFLRRLDGLSRRARKLDARPPSQRAQCGACAGSGETTCSDCGGSGAHLRHDTVTGWDGQPERREERIPCGCANGWRPCAACGATGSRPAA